MRVFVAVFAALAFCLSVRLFAASPWRGTFDERIADATSLERLRWDSRLWPVTNGAVKPAFEIAVPPSVIRDNVDNLLRKSQAVGTTPRRTHGPRRN